MKCPNCGKEIANDSQFCEFCGVKINLASTGDVKREGVVHVRWLLLIMTLLLCFLNMSFFYGWFMKDVYDEYSYFDSSTLWVVPILSFVIFLVSFIITLKKKLKVVYALLLFLIFGINLAIPITAESLRYRDINYKVSISLYENGEYVGYLRGSRYGSNESQKAEQVLNEMLRSAPWKYKRNSSVSLDTESDYRACAREIEDITCLYWSIEALVVVVYFAVALIAVKKEKERNL